MGRYLALGLALKLKITKKNSIDSNIKFHVLNYKDEILSQLNKTFNMSIYSVKKRFHKLEFYIPKKYLDDNIDSLSQEITSIFHTLNIIKQPMKTYHNLEYELLEDSLADNIKIEIVYKILWIDKTKIIGNSNLEWISLLNQLLKNDCGNSVCKNTLFFITD